MLICKGRHHMAGIQRCPVAGPSPGRSSCPGDCGYPGWVWRSECIIQLPALHPLALSEAGEGVSLLLGWKRWWQQLRHGPNRSHLADQGKHLPMQEEGWSEEDIWTGP